MLPTPHGNLLWFLGWCSKIMWCAVAFLFFFFPATVVFSYQLNVTKLRHYDKTSVFMKEMKNAS
uniref:Uncharacterized protein n=1 Tax=Aegilops tauschii subsp. strangulata TaxID=200361 RepID=A0A453GWJ5_AEGTS